MISINISLEISIKIKDLEISIKIKEINYESNRDKCFKLSRRIR